ncbi:MAG: EamA family transporter [Brevundimonas sp.]|uniref:EamA family transporter n=1 Tax=Brevundimonas sp. TaxID=1871086 RepID=UPI0025C6EDBF|nr:EamA family transporter [Brevundimonas sp.]MBX3478056.1 EamA family transporter [Brevundimonas sp.]
MGGAALGLLLALSSALTTACAHALLKSGGDRLTVRLVLGLTQTVVALPFVLLLPLPGGELWPWLAASACAHALYQLVLIRAYDSADFSVAFPLARGAAPLATALLGALWLGDRLSPLSGLGVAVVTGALLLMAAKGRVAPAGLAAAVGAGLLTTTYTLIDAAGVRAAPEPLLFIAWFFLLDGLALAPIALALRGPGVIRAVRAEFRRGVAAGLVSVLAFGAALWALALAPAGGVSALRETSVAFAVLIGAAILKERVGRHRVLAALGVVLGGILVILG